MERQQFWDALRVDKASPLPLYFQVKQAILDAVGAGVLRVGDAIPSEMDLCARYGISRSTIRQTLSELVMEGYLLRQRGKGTVVAAPKVDARFLNKLQSFNEEMRQKGLVPSTRVLSLKRLEGQHAAHERLGLPKQAPLLYLERLRCTNGQPLVYLETYVPADVFPLLAQQDFVRESLYALMEKLHGHRVCRVQRQLEAREASAHEAQLLGIAKGAPVCLVKTVAYTQEGLPVEYSVARYRGDRNTFSLELYR